ncbi:DNA glycosylase [Lyophyllum atratum]|nr:DNA glycosylase [Lyophyllum atratum]
MRRSIARHIISSISIMRTTRSSSRAQAAVTGNDNPDIVVSTLTGSEKRKPDSDATKTPNQKRARLATTPASATLAKAGTLPRTSQSSPSINTSSTSQGALPLLPAVLTFSFEDAKNHLISVDHRFEDLFGKMPCKPYEHLERVHPFRALVSSIVGQQISWLAARSVNHKFVRMYDLSLPEKPDNYEEHQTPTSFFPSPEQVAKSDMTALRSCGLSQRKAEYVQDLANRFADGRLTTEKLMNANDEELAEMLIEVRGIGRWTVDMFAIFSLRRPDILPVGDLGVQRGLLIWFLSLHSHKHKWGFTPQKGGASASSKKKKEKAKPIVSAPDDDELPVFSQTTPSDSKIPEPEVDASTPDISSVPPTSVLENDQDEIPSMPSAFTPSIKKTLQKHGVDEGFAPTPLPAGLTVEILKSRLDGKKKIKGAFLTPKEMEDLTESWRPFRSLGVYYMWSMAYVSE